MPHSVISSASVCCFLATVYSGCLFYEEECDYVETQCWDVVDVYCDAWGCWEDAYTECEDYCVDVAQSTPAPECTSDRHCASGYICDFDQCVPEPDGRPGAGLCESCDVNADCDDASALCLNLTADATIGYCGRGCSEDLDCPGGFECVDLQGADGSQCVPEARTCSGPVVPECDDSADCAEGEVCSGGSCLDAAPDCTENRDCAEGEICSTAGACVDRPDECVDTSDCAPDETCEGGVCVSGDTSCTSTSDCDVPQVCVDGTCAEPECADNSSCNENEECVDGLCETIDVVACTLNVDCGDTGLCVDGNCRTICDADEECPGTQVCRAGLCSPPPEPECAVGADCGEAGAFYCVNGQCRGSCDSDDSCEFGYFCRGFYCDSDPAVECRNNLECGLDERCVEGDCLVECSASCNCPTGLSCDSDGLCRDLGVPDSCETPCDCPGGYECSGSTCAVTGD